MIKPTVLEKHFGDCNKQYFPLTILAPGNVTLKSTSHDGVTILFVKPNGRMSGVEFFQALAEVDKPRLKTESPSCIANLTMNQTDCAITGLAASTRYSIYARSYSLATKYGDKVYLLSVTTSEFGACVELRICLRC